MPKPTISIGWLFGSVSSYPSFGSFAYRLASSGARSVTTAMSLRSDCDSPFPTDVQFGSAWKMPGTPLPKCGACRSSYAFSCTSTRTTALSGAQCAAVTKTVGDTSEPEQSSAPPFGANQTAMPTYGCLPLSGEPLTTAKADAARTPSATTATDASTTAFLNGLRDIIIRPPGSRGPARPPQCLRELRMHPLLCLHSRSIAYPFRGTGC